MASIVPSTCARLVEELADYNQLPAGVTADQVRDMCVEKLWCSPKATQESCLKTARQRMNAWFNTPTPDEKVKKPDITYVEGARDRSTVTDCDQKFIEAKITEEEWKQQCFKPGTWNYKRRDSIRKEFDDRKKFRESLNPWGRFSFKLGLDVMSTGATYKDAFKIWNANSDNISVPFNDARINSGWQRGVRLALTTDPGLTRINFPIPNTLFKFTFFDATVFGGQSINSLDKGAPDAMTWTSSKPLTNGKVFEMELQVPVFDENFFEIGSTIYRYDPFWERGSIFESYLGLNWQFHGNPISLSERLVDARGMAYFLSSYAMLGLRAVGSLGGGGNNPSSNYPGGVKDVSDFCTAVRVKDDTCNGQYILDNKGSKSKFGSYDADKIENISNGMYFHLTAHIFGEERGPGGGFAYRLHADYYPDPQKLETGVQFSFYKSLGKAMEFNLDFIVRGLTSFADDNAINMIDSGYSVLFRTGMSLKPSAIY